jgi:hypothetical protein
VPKSQGSPRFPGPASGCRLLPEVRASCDSAFVGGRSKGLQDMLLFSAHVSSERAHGANRAMVILTLPPSHQASLAECIQVTVTDSGSCSLLDLLQPLTKVGVKEKGKGQPHSHSLHPIAWCVSCSVHSGPRVTASTGLSTTQSHLLTIHFHMASGRWLAPEELWPKSWSPAQQGLPSLVHWGLGMSAEEVPSDLLPQGPPDWVSIPALQHGHCTPEP